MEKADYRQLNGIALAYLGDAVYEVFIRQHLLSTGLSKPTKLQRNANSHTHAKHTAVLTYRISTGFEAVMGYLQLSGQQERLNELAEWCIKQVEAGRTKHED